MKNILEKGSLSHIHETMGNFLHKDQSFKAGVKFALKWYDVNDIEDLLDDENVLAKSEDGKFGVYKGWMIKAKQLDKIAYWRPIDID